MFSMLKKNVTVRLVNDLIKFDVSANEKGNTVLTDNYSETEFI